MKMFRIKYNRYLWEKMRWQYHRNDGFAIRYDSHDDNNDYRFFYHNFSQYEQRKKKATVIRYNNMAFEDFSLFLKKGGSRRFQLPIVNDII